MKALGTMLLCSLTNIFDNCFMAFDFLGPRPQGLIIEYIFFSDSFDISRGLFANLNNLGVT